MAALLLMTPFKHRDRSIHLQEGESFPCIQSMHNKSPHHLECHPHRLTSKHAFFHLSEFGFCPRAFWLARGSIVCCTGE